MSPVFVDTSAILALLVPSDRWHERACEIFSRLERDTAVLVSSSYVLVETYALLGRRFGPAAVTRFRGEFAVLLDIVWVDEPLHETALDILSAKGAGGLSLVDASSFAIMNLRGIRHAFAFDKHFEDAGFSEP